MLSSFAISNQLFPFLRLFDRGLSWGWHLLSIIHRLCPLSVWITVLRQLLFHSNTQTWSFVMFQLFSSKYVCMHCSASAVFPLSLCTAALNEGKDLHVQPLELSDAWTNLQKQVTPLAKSRVYFQCLLSSVFLLFASDCVTQWSRSVARPFQWHLRWRMGNHRWASWPFISVGSFLTRKGMCMFPPFSNTNYSWKGVKCF